MDVIVSSINTLDWMGVWCQTCIGVTHQQDIDPSSMWL